MFMSAVMRKLLSDDFHENSLTAAAVKFAIENLLPGAEVESPCRNRYVDETASRGQLKPELFPIALHLALDRLARRFCYWDLPKLQLIVDESPLSKTEAFTANSIIQNKLLVRRQGDAQHSMRAADLLKSHSAVLLAQVALRGGAHPGYAAGLPGPLRS